LSYRKVLLELEQGKQARVRELPVPHKKTLNALRDTHEMNYERLTTRSAKDNAREPARVAQAISHRDRFWAVLMTQPFHNLFRRLLA
jgi:hypothetical protein